MRDVFVKLPGHLSLPAIRRTPSQALRAVTSKNGLGIYASADRLFRGAVFGRDSLEVAQDLMYAKPRLVKKILLTIASLQGETSNRANEEEPGKIIHEYRLPTIDGKPLNKTSRDIYDRLSHIWGGDDTSLAYYGSIDATPLFIKTLAQYCRVYGMEILTEQVRLRSGKRESLIVILEDALNWLGRHLDNSQSGFVEYLRQNPLGIENQVWKDSNEFYIHRDRIVANHQRPIASIEVQALAYDALVMAAELLPSRRVEMNNYAGRLCRRVFEVLWMDGNEYFALGTDFSDRGELRVIRTITANPAELLDSSIFDELDAGTKYKYIGGIVREIMGTAFLTDAGIRSRSLSEADLVDFWDYHGSFVTWPKETYDIAKGMRRHNLPVLARELENRLLNVIKAAKSYPEFFYVDERGRILGVPTRRLYHGGILSVDSTNRPERIQAWTVSAVIGILNRRGRRAAAARRPAVWQNELEREVLQHIPHVPHLKSNKELSARYPAYPYELNGQVS